MPMEFILPLVCIVVMKYLTNYGAIEERLSELMILEEDHCFVLFHQKLHKTCEKSWNDRHIKQKKFQTRDIVLLYDIKFLNHPEKVMMHRLGPYVIKYVI
jgi:hypothetical protein